ncbi:sulfatase-like hydrolase/transferase [Planctomicrobium piriforme]|uniref:Uncharacterized sulfatase n=1 Tax=Planctomicrobium piriforme TaxID=1576369 RepID=A0A1I3C5B1_9PLAN|nr:sulfatase-like hydrolase/transferase [Planctomicrobium piriforme]SFH69603.1 uncharacterized sulfatase [Planctomicrobium piriforme]
MRFLFVLALIVTPAIVLANDRPNILWLTTEDIGPELGCYGDKYADTPNLDAFAKRSTLYLNAWSNAPVCAPARTTIISGMYASSLGAEHMRSLVKLPPDVKLYPTLMREAGYYCINPGKEDFNIETNGSIWDKVNKKEPLWPALQQHQPFMAVFNYDGTHESYLHKRPHEWKHDPALAPIPPYHPDAPQVREDWAQYYDNITGMDAWFAEQLKQLADAGLADDTIVFFYGDHGSGMPRHKRSLHSSGLRVPLIVHVPEKFRGLLPVDAPREGETGRLVGFVDLAPTVLSLANVQSPATMQGVPFLGQFAASPPQHLFGFRGRMGERTDFSRSARNARFAYIRNYMPNRPEGAHVAYMFETPTTQVWKQMYDAGQLNAAQSAFWQPKPPEELYDLQTDPHELHNLAADPQYAAVLQELRQALHQHLLTVRDPGFLPEDELHSRAPDLSPYELAHDPDKYPLAEILQMADAASLLSPDALDELNKGLADKDSAVRYWAVLGLSMRGAEAVTQAREQLASLLQSDPSPSVRTVVAEALGQYGSPEELQAALAWLLKASNGEQYGPYVSRQALEAIDALGDKARPIAEQLQMLPRTGPWETPRNPGQTTQLLKVILGRFNLPL